jgi:hypothetical protein
MESARNAWQPGLMTPARAVEVREESTTVTHFVGRRKELRAIWGELRQGRHVVLAGHHGMGRTALMRRLASRHEDEARFVFVDFAGTAGAAARGIYGAVSNQPEAGGAALSYKTLRYRLLNNPAWRARRCVLVLDNITRLTGQKLALVRDLAATRRFCIVAIIGTALPAADLMALRRCLNGACVVSLGWLPPRDVAEFFAAASEEHGFGWGAEQIEGLARSLGGYPMGMALVVAHELEERSQAAGRS